MPARHCGNQFILLKFSSLAHGWPDSCENRNMIMATSEPQTESPATRHQQLDADSRVRFDAGACLPSRYPGCTCGLCVEVCPLGAIELESGIPVASDEQCIGCGQCVAACPTAALDTDGFVLPEKLPAEARVQYLDCWRVPLTESPPHTLRVPCFGGIVSGWLLALFDRLAADRERPIHFLDRNGCANCPAGPGIATFHAALAETRTLLTACGVADALLPASTFHPSRQALTPSIPTAASALPLGRRSFLRNLVGGTARTIDAAKAAATPAVDIVLRREILPVSHLRTTAALGRIAQRHGRPAPVRILPQLSVADCDAHGICARVCPTGALQRHEAADGTGAELRFNAALCVACGQCARICPDRALRLSPEGGQAGSETLIRWLAQACATCGETFYGTTGDTCPACRKEQDLFEGAATLFGPAA